MVERKGSGQILGSRAKNLPHVKESLVDHLRDKAIGSHYSGCIAVQNVCVWVMAVSMYMLKQSLVVQMLYA